MIKNCMKKSQDFSLNNSSGSNDVYLFEKNGKLTAMWIALNTQLNPIWIILKNACMIPIYYEIIYFLQPFFDTSFLNSL